jgi:hypothetical protein
MAEMHDVKVENGLSATGIVYGKFFAGYTNVSEMSSSATGPHMEAYLADNGRLGIQYHHLKGPSGVTGQTGPTGPCGPSGSRGDNGPRGFCGPSGSSRMQGGPGPRGFCGPLGPGGARGFCGPRGYCGPSGTPNTEHRVLQFSANTYTESTVNVTSTDMVELKSFSGYNVYTNYVFVAQVRVYNSMSTAAQVHIGKYFGTTEKYKELYRIRSGNYVTVPVFFKGSDSCILKVKKSSTSAQNCTLKVTTGALLGIRV